MVEEMSVDLEDESIEDLFYEALNSVDEARKNAE